MASLHISPVFRLFVPVCALTLLFLIGTETQHGDASHATFVVNYNAQDLEDIAPGDGACNAGFGACSLRAAIQEANAHAGTDTIHFALGAGTPLIQIGNTGLSDLPTITAPVNISGNTGGATRVEVNGFNAGAVGLDVAGGNSLIEGLVITDFVHGGVSIRSDNNTLRNSRIGTDSSGTFSKGNGGGSGPSGGTIDPGGVMIAGDDNTIGGVSAGQGNLISGNDEYGVVIYGDETADNLVVGNYIGTDVTRNATLANGLDGVFILAADDNTIGGTSAGARNVISGNGQRGIFIEDDSDCNPLPCQLRPARQNNIQGNYIGVGASGNSAVPNGSYGVYLSAAGNCLGGIYITFGGAGCTAVANGGNVISGNLASGVRPGISNSVQGNYIGTNAAGTAAVPNGVDGIELPGGRNNIIGGTTAAARNVISGNTWHGIHISLSPNSPNYIQGNYIGLNAAGTGAVGNGANGIHLASTGASHQIEDNVISGNTFDGIRMTPGATRPNISRNFIGTNAAGTADVGNGEAGILVENNGNQIGSAGGNVISGNQDGVVVRGGATATSLFNNYIGTDVTGTVDLGNDRYGVHLSEASAGTDPLIKGFIGTNNPVPNLISGNGEVNLLLSGASTAGYTIVNNIIGPDINGNGAAMTNGVGIRVAGGANLNTIGPGNVISDNTNGVEIIDPGTTRTVVKGNKIGTDLAGTGAVPNSGYGVLISGSPGNTIGGNTAADGNTIAFNGLDGVRVAGSASNSIRRNPIHSNGGLAIDLDPDGVTPNDPVPDADVGANNLQNFPVLTEVATSPSNNTTVYGTISSAANAGYNLDFFENTACDGTGNGEGHVYLGSGQTGSGGSGVASFTINLPVTVAEGHFVTATATRISIPNDTSEFSACLAATPLEEMIVDTTLDATLTACQALVDNDCSLRGAVSNANGAFTAGDLILFDPTDFPAPPAAPGVITLTDTLSLTAGAGDDVIDAAGLGVVIDGAGDPSAFPCFFVEGPGNTIRGLQVTDCTPGILVVGPNNVLGPDNILFDNSVAGVSLGGTGGLVQGNKIGTNVAGSAVHPDGGNETGVAVGGDGNTIGGGAAERNLISGNASGVTVSSGASNNIVKGNYIGTDVTGAVDLGNTSTGVTIAGNSDSNVVGGTGTDEGNLISGNNQNGLRVFGTAGLGQPNETVVQGNKIGTNAAGTSALGNSRNGIIIEGAVGTCVGGSVVSAACVAAPGGGNLVSGNGFSGVLVTGPGTTGNTLFGNFIGTTVAGSGALANSIAGVYLTESGNAVGGPGAGEGNLVAFNGNDGVTVETATGNTVRGNSIHSNGLAAIGNYAGGNGEPGHAPPVILASGSVSGTACLNCVVDVYSDDVNEGRIYHGFAVADGAGNWSFSGAVAGPNVTATATDPDGNTSEFSLPLAYDNDADGVSNASDNCPAWPNPSQEAPPSYGPIAGTGPDSDCDGFTDSRETYLGTDPTKHCSADTTGNNEPAPDHWPVDTNDNRIANTIDVGQFVFVLNETTEEAGSTRLDFNGNGTINTIDVGRYVFVLNKSCAPSGP